MEGVNKIAFFKKKLFLHNLEYFKHWSLKYNMNTLHMLNKLKAFPPSLLSLIRTIGSICLQHVFSQ